MTLIENLTLDEERALYGSEDVHVHNCRFDGEADGESALKESNNVLVTGSYFNLRYPLWHVMALTVAESEMSEKCRAPMWYSSNISLQECKINGTKALRECNGITIEDCNITSDEFGWSCSNIKAERTTFNGEYFMLRAKNAQLFNCVLNGKYSYQYLENAIFENCTLNTKDAFWHSKNVTLRNCKIRGEYLGWYSENLTLENCVIIGTQPLCYCKGLVLKECEMLDADLSFEKSEVHAELTKPIISIKNPLSGEIYVPFYDELIMTQESSAIIKTDYDL